MARVKGGYVTRQRRKRTIKLAKGYYGAKSISYKMAKQQVMKSRMYAFRDRKQTKRNFRRLWICLLYTSPSPRDLSTSRMPSSA